MDGSLDEEGYPEQASERGEPADWDWPSGSPWLPSLGSEPTLATLEEDPASEPDRGTVGSVSIEARGVTVRLDGDIGAGTDRGDRVCSAGVAMIVVGSGLKVVVATRPVVHAITSNIHSFSVWGSPTGYFALYEAPLSRLRDEHATAKVRRWAKATLRDIAATSEGIRNEEDEWEAPT